MCAQVTCRPGGDACKGLNLWDYQTFAGKERLHGLKYQGAVMPNGIVLVWGPWRGTEHDAGNLYESRLLDMLREARDTIDTLPGYPKGAELCDRIDAICGENAAGT